ncbi:MAG: DMT family transporter [Pseudomonadota bacterium]
MSVATRILPDDPASRLRGYLLMTSGVLCFGVLDTMAKVLTEHYSIGQILWARNIGGLLFALAICLPKRGLGVFRSQRQGLQVTRGLLLVITTALNFLALSYLPLATNAAILYTAPLFICALSVPILGEKVGWRRWTAIGVGFLGAMIVVRPGLAGFHWAVLISLLAAFTIAFYNMATREVARQDDHYTSLTYVSVVATLASTPFAFLDWRTPEGWDILLFLALGVAGSLGHFLLIIAHGLAPASALAPYVYTQIIWVAILGYVVFNHLPDQWVWIGAGLVSASGLYLGYRERKVKGLG